MQKIKDIVVIVACVAITAFVGFQAWQQMKLLRLRFPSLKSKENSDAYIVNEGGDTPKHEAEATSTAIEANPVAEPNPNVTMISTHEAEPIVEVIADMPIDNSLGTIQDVISIPSDSKAEYVAPSPLISEGSPFEPTVQVVTDKETPQNNDGL